jgi:hypothetical protein
MGFHRMHFSAVAMLLQISTPVHPRPIANTRRFDTTLVAAHSDTQDNASTSGPLEYGHRFLAIVIEPHGVESKMVYRSYWSVD